MKPRVSIVVPSRAVDAEVRTWTTNSFHSLHANTPYELYQLIVIENVTCSMIGCEYDPGIYVRTAEAGLSRAVNMGIRLADTEYVCISGTDVFYTPGWLENLIRVYESIPPFGVLSPQTEDGPDGLTFDEHWWACVLIRQEWFRRYGLLDEETFPWTYADQDWDCRARFNGLKIARTGDARVRHINMATRSRVQVPDAGEKERMIARWGFAEFNEWVRHFERK